MTKLYYKKLLILLSIIVFLNCNFGNFFETVTELSFNTSFVYPLEGDLSAWIQQAKKGKPSDVKQVSHVKYNIVTNPDCRVKGKETVEIVLVVKSALKHWDNRKVIRKTWGNEESRFGNVRTVFLVGGKDISFEWKKKLRNESAQFQDLVVGNFKDTYENVIIKTRMGLEWSYKECFSVAKFFFFIDDDCYVSIKNAFTFLRNQSSENHLYAGKINFKSGPIRTKLHSTWFITGKDYPYNLYPPYAAGAGYFMSRKSVSDFYWASLFIEPFPFDDVYLGIINFKLNMTSTQIENQFRFPDPLASNDNVNYSTIILQHRFKYPNELLSFWKKQFEAGYA